MAFPLPENPWEVTLLILIVGFIAAGVVGWRFAADVIARLRKYEQEDAARIAYFDEIRGKAAMAMALAADADANAVDAVKRVAAVESARAARIYGRDERGHFVKKSVALPQASAAEFVPEP